MRKSRVAIAALVTAVTLLSLAAKAQGPGQGGQPPSTPPASPEPSPAAKPGEGAGAGPKPEAAEAPKTAEPAPSTGAGSPAAPSAGDTQSATLAALLQEGFEVRATAFAPADAVTRRTRRVTQNSQLTTHNPQRHNSQRHNSQGNLKCPNSKSGT